MKGKLPPKAAILLILSAQIGIAAQTGTEPVTVETRKIPVSADLSRPVTANPLDSSRPPTSPRSTRVLFITAKGCSRCQEALAKLNKPGGDFETMRSLGWKIGDGSGNHIQIIDKDEIPDVVKKLNAREFPTVACIENDEIVRSFKDGCTTPLDAWTFGWLMKGQSERPASSIPEAARVETTGNYRLRGNHWTVEGDPNPAKQTIVNHLRGANHGHALASYGAIENWSYEELRSLHDDLHEREGGTYGNVAVGNYQPATANRSLDAFSGNRKVLGR